MAQQNHVKGYLNHVSAEEAQDASNVVLGMFFFNSTPASVFV
jgi:hypothetical protein